MKKNDAGYTLIAIDHKKSAGEIAADIRKGLETFKKYKETIKKLTELKDKHGVLGIIMWNNRIYNYDKVLANITKIDQALSKLTPNEKAKLKRVLIIIGYNDTTGLKKAGDYSPVIIIDPPETVEKITTCLQEGAKEFGEYEEAEEKLRGLTTKHKIKGIIMWGDKMYNYQAILTNIPKIDQALTALTSAEKTKLQNIPLVLGVEGRTGKTQSAERDTLIAIDYEKPVAEILGTIRANL